MIEPFEENPRRLAEEDSELGNLLRTVLDEPGEAPDESEHWRGVCTRQVARRQRARAVGAGLALTVGVGLVWAISRQGGDSVAIGREPVTPNAPRAEPAPALSQNRGESAERALSPAPSFRVPISAVPSVTPSASPARTDTSECVRRVRAADYAGAVQCYDAISNGSGLGAELALYEKARLQARALGNPSAALQTLDQHTQRFGNGSLSTEVAVTRIELLVSTGRSADALTAIDRALASGAGSERAGDLHALRGDLLRGAGNCVAALAEYTIAEQNGVHSARLERGRELCAAASHGPSPASGAEVDSTGLEAPEKSR